MAAVFLWTLEVASELAVAQPVNGSCAAGKLFMVHVVRACSATGRAGTDWWSCCRAGGVGQDFSSQHSGGDIAFAAFHMWPDKYAQG